MDKRDYLRLYCRSPLGIGSLAAATGAGLAVGSGAGLGAAAGILTAALVLTAAFILSLFTGLGPRAAVTESERGAAERAASRLAAAAQARDRLAAIRLAIPGAKGAGAGIAEARDLVVLEADRFLEACRRSGSYDPEGVDAISGTLGLVDAWLRERDETASERRFGLDDADPFPAADERTVAALRERAAFISRRRRFALGEPSPGDSMEIEEEPR